MRIAEAYVDMRANLSGFQADLMSGRNMLSSSMMDFATIARRGAAMLGVALSMQQLISQTKRAVMAAAEEEASQNRLVAALHQTSQYSKESFDSLNKLAGSMQYVTGTSDETIRGLMATALVLGELSAKEVPAAIKAAFGLSTLLNTDVSSAMSLLTRAIHGTFTEFRQFRSQLNGLATDQERLNFIMQRGLEGTALMTQQMSGTTGALSEIRVATDEAREAFGRGVLETLNLKAASSGLKASLAESSEEMTGLGQVVGALGSGFVTLMMWTYQAAFLLKSILGGAIGFVSYGIGLFIENLAKVTGYIPGMKDVSDDALRAARSMTAFGAAMALSQGGEIKEHAARMAEIYQQATSRQRPMTAEQVAQWRRENETPAERRERLMGGKTEIKVKGGEEETKGGVGTVAGIALPPGFPTGGGVVLGGVAGGGGGAKTMTGTVAGGAAPQGAIPTPAPGAPAAPSIPKAPEPPAVPRGPARTWAGKVMEERVEAVKAGAATTWAGKIAEERIAANKAAAAAAATRTAPAAPAAAAPAVGAPSVAPQILVRPAPTAVLPAAPAPPVGILRGIGLGLKDMLGEMERTFGLAPPAAPTPAPTVPAALPTGPPTGIIKGIGGGLQDMLSEMERTLGLAPPTFAAPAIGAAPSAVAVGFGVPPTKAASEDLQQQQIAVLNRIADGVVKDKPVRLP